MNKDFKQAIKIVIYAFASLGVGICIGLIIEHVRII